MRTEEEIKAEIKKYIVKLGKRDAHWADIAWVNAMLWFLGEDIEPRSLSEVREQKLLDIESEASNANF